MNDPQNYAEMREARHGRTIYYTIPFIVNSHFPTQNRSMDRDRKVNDSRLRSRETE